ncbi:NAD(P)-binding protein [Sarocladium strictum]
MVKVAVAGANSGLALEVIDKLVEGQKHEVLALTRRDPASCPQQPGVIWRRVSFEDKAELVRELQGAEVVLNFIVVNEDADNTVGKLVIDASVEAGVKRFAPSEWAMGQKLEDVIDRVSWYRSKLAIRDYLRELNREKQVIEYSLFQPGVFLDYLIFPQQFSKHVPAAATSYSLSELRIRAVKGHEDDPVVFTSVADIAHVVRRAVEYDGKWPEIGGIRGDRLSAREMQQRVEKITGKKVDLLLAEQADLDAGQLKVDMPVITHKSIPEDQREAYHVPVWTGMLTATAKGANDVTGEWNELLPDLEFDTVESFTRKLWEK